MKPRRRQHRMWAARTNSLDQLAAAVNAHFTNGTPMRDVEAVIGRPSYTRTRTPIPPETQKPMIWVYGFGPGRL
jgi:hypothetical protein